MEIFENSVDEIKFRSTNAIWNELALNSPWSVGYVTTLISSRDFTSKEEWKKFYYKSGEERNEKLALLNNQDRAKLTDFTKSSPDLSYDKKNLNLAYGRTEYDLNMISKYLFEKINENGNSLKITLAECAFIVKYRVMGETWNGVIVREINTVKELQKNIPGVIFIKTEGDIDYKYGVDYEVFDKTRRVCAIQVKPPSYKTGKSPEILKAKSANELKNKLYEDDFSSKVFYIYSRSNGQIENLEVVSEIKKFIL